MPLHDSEMAKMAEPAIARAEEILTQLGSFDAIRRYYEAREIAIHDEITRLTGARAEGLAEGIEKGRTEGRAEGKAEGKAEGEMKKTRQIAQSLLDILDDKTIAEKTGLSLEDVAKLRLQ